ASKVNEFLALLDGLRAKAFVPGPQKPEYALPPEQGGLEVTILLEGHPGIALNIGGPADGGASFYGWTNDPAAGGSVFTVAAGRPGRRPRSPAPPGCSPPPATR